MEKKLPKKRFTQEEAKVIQQVRSDYYAAKTARRTNSYWTDTDSDKNSDWNERWDLQEKINMGWSEPSSADEFESNVKSPMTSGRIESTMHKLRKLDVQFVVRPDNVLDDEDKRKARVIQELLNNLFERKYFKERLNEWYQDALIHGSSFLHVYYLKKGRKVKMPKLSDENLSDEDKENLENGKRLYDEEFIYDYDDIAFEPVKIQEIYVDPSARNLHGTSYEAQYIIRRMLPSYAQFKAMFSKDPDVIEKNFKKVRPASYYQNDDSEFFEPPKDVDNDDYVEVLHYYNKAEDKYVVVANDVLIKDMPLPYMHKQLPFVKINVYDVLHQFYGMGIPDRLKNIQGEEEILKNLTYDRLHITANPILTVRKGIYGEFSKAYQNAKAGTMLPVNNQDDVSTVNYPTMNFDMFRGIEALNRDAVLATQIDPIQMGVNQKYVSATTSMITKEQMDAFIMALIDNWTEALTIAAKQTISLMSQFYTVPRIKDAGETASNRQMRLVDIEINPETLEVKENMNTYSYLEIKPDFFNINGDWSIEIAPESVEVQSRAIEMQKSQANLAQLAPFFVDPSNPESAMSNPNGWVDGPKTLKWYFEKNNLPTELMATLNEDEDIARKRANLQGKLLLASRPVEGIPGESEGHKRVHLMQIMEINNKRKRLEAQILERYGANGEDITPYLINSPEGMALEKLDKIADLYAQHLMTDDQPKPMQVPAAVQAGQPQPQTPDVPMPPGLNEATGGQAPMVDAGNQQGGMMPQEGMVAQGRPPMAQG